VLSGATPPRFLAPVALVLPGNQGRRISLLVIHLVGTPGALHPFPGRQLGPGMGHLHEVVAELPVSQVLEEVRLAIQVLERRVNVVAHSRPDAHVSRIKWVHLTRGVVESPVQSAAGEEGIVVVAPHEGGIDVGQSGRQTQIGERLGEAGSQVHRVEHVILTTYEEKNQYYKQVMRLF